MTVRKAFGAARCYYLGHKFHDNHDANPAISATAKTTGTSLSQGGSGVMNGVPALKARGETADGEAFANRNWRPTVMNRRGTGRQIGGTGREINHGSCASGARWVAFSRSWERPLGANVREAEGQQKGHDCHDERKIGEPRRLGRDERRHGI
jgi:hypothetical protein